MLKLIALAGALAITGFSAMAADLGVYNPGYCGVPLGLPFSISRLRR